MISVGFEFRIILEKYSYLHYDFLVIARDLKTYGRKSFQSSCFGQFIELLIADSKLYFSFSHMLLTLRVKISVITSPLHICMTDKQSSTKTLSYVWVTDFIKFICVNCSMGLGRCKMV